MKLSKKILSIVLSALMVVSMLPMTALAATTLTKETNTANSTYASVVLYNGVDYIAYAYSGFTPITGDANNAIGEITINKGQSLSFNNGCSQMNGDKTTPATLGWHWGAKASWGGTYYCIATDKAFEGTCSDTSVSVGMSGFGSTTVDNDVIGPNANADATTSYVTTAFNNVGTYYITITYKYQMKSKRFSYSTQKEITSSDVLKVNVVCPHTSTRIEGASTSTCTVAGSTGKTICNDCGATVKEATALTLAAHSYTVLKEAEVAPTCTKAGKTAVMKCANCEATQGGTTIQATGNHDLEGVEWTKDAYKHSKICKTCELEVVSAAHTPVSANNAVAPQIGVAGKEADTVCDVCGYVITEGATIDPLSGPNNTASTTLADDVIFNFSIDTNYYLENDFKDDAVTAEDLEYVVEYVEYTVEDGNEAGTKQVKTQDVIVEDGKTLIQVPTAPAQLTEKIKITLKAKDNSVSTTVVNNYSMKDYCDAVIDRELASAPVCDALITYAATAQTYFNYNTEDMAEEVDEAQLDADYNAVVNTVNATANISGAIDGMSIKNVSCVALSDTVVRFYLANNEEEFYYANGKKFTYGQCEISEVTMDGQTGTGAKTAYFGKTADGKVYIAVSGIESANLDNTFHVTVSAPNGQNMTIDYSATAFCKSAVKTTSVKAELKSLAKALLLYNVAADEVFTK